MSYKTAVHTLPAELLEKIQEYVDGECLYIPRKTDSKRAWGTSTNARTDLQTRDQQICRERREGQSVKELSERYYLSVKSIQRILRGGK